MLYPMWNILNFGDVLIEFDGILLFCVVLILFSKLIFFIASCNIGDNGELCWSYFILFSDFNTISVISLSLLFSSFSLFDVSFFYFRNCMHIFTRCSILPFSIYFVNYFLYCFNALGNWIVVFCKNSDGSSIVLSFVTLSFLISMNKP